MPVADTDVPAPAAGGTRQECTVSGLQPFQTYSFAIRADDNAGNSSPVSIPTTALTATPGDETELVEKLEWVEARPEADHTARFRIRDLARVPARLEEVIAEIAMGRSQLER